MSGAAPCASVEETPAKGATLHQAADEPAVKEEEPEVVDLADDDDDFDKKLLNGKGADKQEDEVEGLNGKVGEPLNSQQEEELLATKEEEEELCLSNTEVLDELKEESDSEMCVLAEIKSLDQQTDTAADVAGSKKPDLDNSGVAGSEDPSPANTDPYAYLNQGGFSSENFKIELRGMPKYYGLAELKKLLNDTLKLGSNKIKPGRQGTHLFVCFRSEEGKKQALETLNGYSWKNSKLTALHAKPAQDPLVRKRKQDADNQESGKQSKMTKSTLSFEERLKMNTVPYHTKPYENQLECKMEAMRKALRQMSSQLAKAHPELRGWLKQQELKHDGLPCELRPIRPSPTLDGYRNKCEFTIGLHPETQKPTVGFRLGSYASGEVGVFPADSLRHIPDQMKQVAKIFEQMVLDSPHPPFHPESRAGVWQTLGVRSTQGGELMVTVVCQVESLTPDQLDTLKAEIKAFFSEGLGKDLGVNSLYFHPMTKKEKGVLVQTPVLLLGEPYVTEDLLGLKLRISPLAFFQVNTLATEELYSAVSELAAPTPDSTLLDICCGTGSIGLSLAKDCGQVLGLEIVGAAVEDAKANAQANGLSHCDFFAGSAETILGAVLARATRPELVGVLDPPRPGVAQKVIATIRRSSQLKRLVYMACCPQAVQHNFRDLGRAASKTMGGHPFLPVCAIPVDLFPHTPHCELVLLFERVDPASLPPAPPASSAETEKVEPQSPKKRRQRRTRAQRAQGANPGGELTVTGSSASAVEGKEKLRQTKRGPASIRKSRFLVWPAARSTENSLRYGRQSMHPMQLRHGTQWDRSLRGLGRGLGPMRATLSLPRPGGTFRPPPLYIPGAPKPLSLKPLREPGQAERLGRSWAGQLPIAALCSAEAIRREEEEAVRRFKEGFAAAVQDSRARLQVEESRRFSQEPLVVRNRIFNSRGKPYREQVDTGLEAHTAPLVRTHPPRKEKMIPESVVNKLLEDYRRDIETQHTDKRFADAERYEMNRSGIKIREVYIEKETWPNSEQHLNDRDYFPAANRPVPLMSGATTFYGAAPSNYKEPLLPAVPIYDFGREEGNKIQPEAGKGKRKRLRLRKSKKPNPNGSPQVAQPALNEYQEDYQTTPPRPQQPYLGSQMTSLRTEQSYQGGQATSSRAQRSYQGGQMASTRTQPGGQMASTKMQEQGQQQQGRFMMEANHSRAQQIYQRGPTNAVRTQQSYQGGQVNSGRAKQSYQGGQTTSPRAQQGYQGGQMTSARAQQQTQQGRFEAERILPRAQQSYQGSQMASTRDQLSLNPPWELEQSIRASSQPSWQKSYEAEAGSNLSRAQQIYQRGPTNAVRTQQSYQGGQVDSGRAQQSYQGGQTTSPRAQQGYQGGQMTSARAQQQTQQGRFETERILPRAQQSYQGSQMASTRAEQLSLNPPWELEQSIRASSQPSWQKSYEAEAGSSLPQRLSRDIRTRLGPRGGLLQPADERIYRQDSNKNNLSSNFIQSNTIAALYGKPEPPPKFQDSFYHDNQPAQSARNWGASEFY